jgi:hypothetical protein
MRYTDSEKELAERFKVPIDRVSSSRDFQTDEEVKANEQMDSSYKAQAVLNGQKEEVLTIGGMQMAI